MIQAIRNLTTAQALLLAGGVVGLFTGIAPLWLDPKIVATIGGSLITFIGVVGTAFTGQAQQLKDVANYPGVTAVQTNQNANAAVKAVADDDNAPKVLPPK